MYITTRRQLAEFIDRARSSDILAVDTEFLRERTYWPKLCLIQLGTEEESVAVDPFSVGDLSPLAELFCDPGITKLFHAAGQDMEIIHHELGIIPAPVFDTQIAASLLGGTMQIGYGTLVLSECGVKLKKADSFTDWSTRPLAPSQIDYALDDVVYLPQLYRSMRAELERLGRLSWLDPDFAELTDEGHYAVNPYDRYRHLRRVSQLSRRQMSAAREVAAWRENEAMRRDVPRKWVVTDEQIVESCKREPTSIDDLFMVRGIRGSLTTADARAMLRACRAGLDAPAESWPELTRPSKSEPNVDAQVDLLHALVQKRAKENDVACAVLASHDDLVKIARGHGQSTDVMRGWRRELVGEELLALMRGDIALTIGKGVVKVTDASQNGR